MIALLYFEKIKMREFTYVEDIVFNLELTRKIPCGNINVKNYRLVKLLNAVNIVNNNCC